MLSRWSDVPASDNAVAARCASLFPQVAVRSDGHNSESVQHVLASASMIVPTSSFALSEPLAIAPQILGRLLINPLAPERAFAPEGTLFIATRMEKSNNGQNQRYADPHGAWDLLMDHEPTRAEMLALLEEVQARRAYLVVGVKCKRGLAVELECAHVSRVAGQLKLISQSGTSTMQAVL